MLHLTGRSLQKAAFPAWVASILLWDPVLAAVGAALEHLGAALERAFFADGGVRSLVRVHESDLFEFWAVRRSLRVPGLQRSLVVGGPGVQPLWQVASYMRAQAADGATPRR